MRLPLALALLLSFSAPALAHSGADHATGFVAGLAHPIGGLDHVLAMVAVGVFAAILGGRALWLVPASFVAMMIIGFAAGLAGAEIPMTELGIALSSVVIGGVAALGQRMPVALASALVGMFAVFHGVAHGAETPAGGNSLYYALGFVAATSLLHATGIGLLVATGRLAKGRGFGLARVMGGLFAAGGLGVLAGWL